MRMNFYNNKNIILNQRFSKCGPGTNSMSITGEAVRNANPSRSGPTPDLLSQKLWEWAR